MATTDTEASALARKVAFLSRSEAYPDCPPGVIRCETHMSWVFLAGERAYKLKKPVRFPYLDFSTREARERTGGHVLALCRRQALMANRQSRARSQRRGALDRRPFHLSREIRSSMR
jgi:hypothetical protein